MLSRTINFNLSGKTDIKGPNKSGKTTIADAYSYVITGKNAQDKKDFSYKPLDSNNKTIDRTETEVVALFEVNGKDIRLGRKNREVWVRPSGKLEQIMTGNETLYSHDDGQIKAGEYQTLIAEELIEEGLLKMLTSPTYFMSLDWKIRRSRLVEVSGDVSDDNIAKSRTDFEDLFIRLAGKPFDKRRQEITANKKKTNTELVQIPARIDEIQRGMPEKPDLEALTFDLKNAEAAIEECNTRIKESNGAHEPFYKARSERNIQIFELQTEMFKLLEAQKTLIRGQYSLKADRKRELSDEIRSLSRQIDVTNNLLENMRLKVKELEIDRKTLLDNWHLKDKEQLVFNNNCPISGRFCDIAYTEEEKEERLLSHNRAKSATLEGMTNRGKGINEEKDRALKVISESEEVLKTQKAELERLQEEHRNIPATPIDELIVSEAQTSVTERFEYQEAKKEMDELLELNRQPVPATVDLSESEESRKFYEHARDNILAKMGDIKVIETNEARQLALSLQAMEYSQQIADMERDEFLMAEFERAKMGVVESRVNSLFTTLKVKMFKKNITNDGVEPCCEMLVDGVPFADANTASQINAGLEIINLLSEFYQVSAPVFIDGRESVTDIINTKGQVINLIVAPDQETLTIN
jgi:hypothetical protein